METDHLDREARFSRSRPPSLRNLALAAAALLLVTGARPAPQQNDHDRAFGPRPTANATRPVAPDPIDAQRDFKPTLVDCAKLKPKKAPAPRSTYRR